MRAARLDSRVRAEAQALVREAYAALQKKPKLRSKAGDLETAVRDVDQALAAKDYQRVRRALPALDALVDELVKRPAKSTTRDYVESIGAAVLIALGLRAVVLEAFKIPSSSMYPSLEINDHIFVNKFLYGVRIPYTTTKLLEWRKPRRGEVIVFMQPCTPDKDFIKRVIATEGQTVEVRCNVVYVDGQPIEHELLDGETCQYDDQREGSTEWTPTKCSLYRERVDGHDYLTYHERSRPLHDAQRRASPQSARADDKDFPKLFGSAAPPSCRTGGDLGPDREYVQAPGEIKITRDAAGECELQRHYVVPPGHVFVMGDNRANSNDSRFWGAVPIANIKGKALFIWLSYHDLTVTQWPPKLEIRWNRVGNFVK